MTTTSHAAITEAPEFEPLDHEAVTLVELSENRRFTRLLHAGAAVAVIAAGIQLSAYAQTRIRGK